MSAPGEVSNPLSREARDAMRARVEKATPGPWSQGMIGDRLINEVDNQAAFGFITITANYSDDGAGGVADADFVANAITDIPTLLDALDAAEALVSTLAEALEVRHTDNHCEWGNDCHAECAQLGRDEADAALASYQEWDRSRANPSTGEGTE